MIPSRQPRMLCIFITVLFTFLILTAVLVAYQQRGLLRSSVHARAAYDLDLMADATLESLLKSDYSTVRTFVERWGGSHEDIRAIRIVAPNGFVLAEYRNDAPAAGETYVLSKEVKIGKTTLATIHFVGDYREAEMLALQLRNRLILAAVIITALLGTALWFTFRKMALAPLEKMVDERTSALLVANQELEQEITDRKNAEQLLKVREEHIALILDSVAEGIYGVDLQGNCTFCNPAALRMLGFEGLEKVIGRKIHPLIHNTRFDGTPLQAEDCEIYRTCHEGKGAHADDEVFWRTDGTNFPVEYWVQPIMHNGLQIGAVTAFIDISERKRTAQTLRESERLLRETQTVAGLGSYMLTIATGDWISSDILDRIFGIDETFVRTVEGWVSLIHPDDRAMMMDHFMNEVVGKHHRFNKEYRIVRNNDHEERWVHGMGDLELNDEGKPVRMIGIIQDITERKHAAEALYASEQRFREIIENISLIGVMLDSDGRILLCNNYLLSITGWKLEEVVNRSWFELFLPPEVRAEIENEIFLRSIRSGDIPVHYENAIITRQGERRLIAWSNTVLRDKSGAVTGVASIGEDITERQKLEEQLRQSQKMESIGTLAGGVAHDFNNILSAISGYGHLTLMKMAQNDPLRPNIQQILEASDRAAHLTRELLLFSRKQPIDRKPVDLNEGIQKLAKFLVRVIGEDIAFKTMLSGGTMPVLADAHQIDQVLMNLATNARDAMPKGGVFTIKTEQVQLDKELTSSLELEMPGKYALISVSDTGEGINEETRQRIFEPFFTTKEVGKGTGLGLSVVYGIVKQHDGSIMVYSEPGLGTTFRIYLPIKETNAAEDQAPVVEEQPVGGTETILLAEDDKTVREMTWLLLQNFGYTVITAVDGEDAVRTFTENKDKIHLLLFDLIMPKKNGKDAYDEIRKMRSDIKVIFASGYDPDLVRQRALLEQNVPVVYKPVPTTALLKKIRIVLDDGKKY